MTEKEDRKRKTENRKQRKSVFYHLSSVIYLLFLGLIIIIVGQTEAEDLRVGLSPAGKNLRKTYIDKEGYTRIEAKVKGPGLLITWPPLERKEVNLKRMRLAGATLPSAAIRINGAPVRVYPTGAFATLLNLKEIGENRIEVVAEDASGETRQTIILRRRRPPATPLLPANKQNPPLGTRNGQSIKRPPLNWNSESPLRGLIVVVDPGHGGKFPGAVGPTGLEEKEVNLKISLALTRNLRRVGAEVILTRQEDKDIPLAKRTEIALSRKEIGRASCGERV